MADARMNESRTAVSFRKKRDSESLLTSSSSSSCSSSPPPLRPPASVPVSPTAGRTAGTSSSRQMHGTAAKGGSEGILCLSLNQEQDMFACATDSGLRIYNLDPLLVKSTLEVSEVGTVRLAELVHRSNLVVLVAGGSAPKFADNTVLVWDDARRRLVLELTFGTPVVGLKVRKERLLVAERTRVHVFSFPHEVRKLLTLETRDNGRGLMCVSRYASSERQLLVLPAHKPGSLLLTDLSAVSEARSSKSSAPVTIDAHRSEVTVMALDAQAVLLATASATGTLVRVWDTQQTRSVCLMEVRRGADAATLFCLSFSPGSEFVLASSDKGTVHVFAVRQQALNRRSSLAPVTGLLGSYGHSQWALSTFALDADHASLCAFPADGLVVALCADGSYHKFSFHADGSRTRDAYDRFLDLPDQPDF